VNGITPIVDLAAWAKKYFNLMKALRKRSLAI